MTGVTGAAAGAVPMDATATPAGAPAHAMQQQQQQQQQQPAFQPLTQQPLGTITEETNLQVKAEAAVTSAPAVPPAPLPLVWLQTDVLLLLSLVHRSLLFPTNALPSPTTRVALEQLVDWNLVSSRMEERHRAESLGVVPGLVPLERAVFTPEACLAQLQLLMNETRAAQAAAAVGGTPPAIASLPPLGPVSPAELVPFIGATSLRLRGERLATLLAEQAQTNAKIAHFDATMASVQAALSAQQAEQARVFEAAEAAKRDQQAALEAQQKAQQAAADAATAAAAAAVQANAAASSALPPVAPLTHATPHMSVSLQPMSAAGSMPLTRPSSLLSPMPVPPAAAMGGMPATQAAPFDAAAAAAASSAASAAARPAALNILSPTSTGIPGLAPGGAISWPNSALHTPLKQPSMSRQHSAQSSGTPAPATPLGRQESVPRTPLASALAAASPSSAFPPSTPAASASASAASLSPAVPPPSWPELYQVVLNTLTSREEAGAFLEPVAAEDAVGYYDVIKNPMSFADVRAKLKDGVVRDPLQLYNLFGQIYSNCYQYNDKKTIFFKQARTLENLTNELFRAHFPTVPGPWQMSGRKGPGGRPSKSALMHATPHTPALTSQQSYASSSPAPSPTPASAAAAAAGAAGGWNPAPLDFSNAGDGAAVAPMTPSGSRSLSMGGTAGSPDLSKVASASKAGGSSAGAGGRRPSMSTPAGSPLLGGARKRDGDGDELMQANPPEGEMSLAAGAGGASQASGAEGSTTGGGGGDTSEFERDESVAGDDTDGHATPARGGAGANRKRGPTTPSAASARKASAARRKGTEPATPVAGAQPSPAASATGGIPAGGFPLSAIDEPMDLSEGGAAPPTPSSASEKKSNRGRGRPNKK